MSSDVHVSGGMAVDLAGAVGISGIPSSYSLAVTALPKITLAADPVEATLTLRPITVEPVSINVAITEIPELRTHLPADFTVGLHVLGMPLLSVRLCGEAQMINEAYRSNPCERCARDQDPDPGPDNG